MGFQLGPGGRAGSAPGMRISWAVGLGIALIVMLAAWLALRSLLGSNSQRTDSELAIDPRPVIISLQQVGELHTVKLNMKDVLSKASDKPAEGWLHDVPGADAVSRWATHNQALVVAEGSVEAGIDLSLISSRDVTPIRLKDGKPGLRVHLPDAQIFAPNVVVHVEKTENGLFWKDENLIPKAEAEASRRFRDAAEKDHIKDHARENAIQHLQQMEQSLGHDNVEFYF